MAATDLVAGAETGTPAKAAGGFARVWRTLKQLFHEVVGGIFAVLALAWVQSAVRAWTRDVAHWVVFVAGGVAVLLVVLSWGAFRRARQLR